MNFRAFVFDQQIDREVVRESLSTHIPPSLVRLPAIPRKTTKARSTAPVFAHRIFKGQFTVPPIEYRSEGAHLGSRCMIICRIFAGPIAVLRRVRVLLNAHTYSPPVQGQHRPCTHSEPVLALLLDVLTAAYGLILAS